MRCAAVTAINFLTAGVGLPYSVSTMAVRKRSPEMDEKNVDEYTGRGGGARNPSLGGLSDQKNFFHITFWPVFAARIHEKWPLVAIFGHIVAFGVSFGSSLTSGGQRLAEFLLRRQTLANSSPPAHSSCLSSVGQLDFGQPKRDFSRPKCMNFG